MNVACFMGRLGRDSKTNQTQGGTSVCNFALAVDSGFGDNKQTVWLDCALWGKRAEGGLPGYLVKGAKVVVSGELGTREFQDNNGQTRQAVTLRVNELSLAGDNPNSGQQQGQQAQQQRPPQQQGQGFGQPSGQPAPQPNQGQQGGGLDDFDDDKPSVA